MWERDQVGIRCVFMRGGTSRGAYFHECDLPRDPALRDQVLLAVYGSPDPRQIDGIGGADPLTSKAIIVAPSASPELDVEYTFAQVGIDNPQVSYGGNCGNMLAGVGPFAVDEGLVPAVEPVTTVRILNRNTGKRIVAEVPVRSGRARTQGDCRIAGVPRAGACILLNFVDVAGSVTGRLLPTGRPVDTLRFDGRTVPASIVDAATPFVFVRAADLGLEGSELPDALAGRTDVLGALERLRQEAAAAIGLAPSQAANIPRIALVAAPRTYRSTSGSTVDASSVDLTARQLSMGRPHKTLAVTGSICISVAARLPGTVVADLAAARESGAVSIGHPGGVLRVEVEVAGGEVRRAAVERTARRIMEGTVFVPAEILAAAPALAAAGEGRSLGATL